MTHWVVTHLDYFFAHYGYRAVFIGILLESAGAFAGRNHPDFGNRFRPNPASAPSIVDVAIVAVIADEIPSRNTRSRRFPRSRRENNFL